MVIKKLFLVVIIFALLPAHAESIEPYTGRILPKWEMGLFGGGFYIPDYPGSEESNDRYLALPYFIYRGEILTADRDGKLRTRFLTSEFVEFDLSFGAGFKADSDDNAARAGMPDLDWLGEIGPQLIFHLRKGPMMSLDLHVPARYVFSTDFKKSDTRGWVFQPDLRFRHRLLFAEKSFVMAGLSPMWATRPLHEYFYEVSSNYATVDRPTYDADGGYFGTRTFLSAVKILKGDLAIFAAVSKSFYAEAKNRNSPLMRDIENESFVVGAAWGFYKSETKASVEASQSSGDPL